MQTLMSFQKGESLSGRVHDEVGQEAELVQGQKSALVWMSPEKVGSGSRLR